jgi:hypothetical protein
MCATTSVRAQLLVHRGSNKCLSCLFGRHLPFKRQATAAHCIGANVAVRPGHVPVQNLEALKRTAYLFLDAAMQSDNDRLPLNFAWFADVIQVHSTPPKVFCRETHGEAFCSAMASHRGGNA